MAPTAGVIGGSCLSGDKSWISILYCPDRQVETITGRAQQFFFFFFGSAIVCFVVVLGVGQIAGELYWLRANLHGTTRHLHFWAGIQNRKYSVEVPLRLRYVCQSIFYFRQ